MAFEWFRSWHGAPTDAKYRVIARRAGVTPGMVSAVYWALLDYASQNEPRGSVEGFDTETYAEWAGWEEGDVLAILDAFTIKQAIIDGRIVAWDKRQPKREDPTGAERQARYRDAQRNASNDADTLPDDVTQSNATSRDVTQKNARLDKIREDSDEIRQDERREDSAPAAAPSKPPRTVIPGSQQDMFGAIAETCQLDAKLKQGQIARMSKALLEAGYSPAQVRAFPAWWQSHDWRAKNTPVPTMQHVQELIKQSTMTNGKTPGKAKDVAASKDTDELRRAYTGDTAAYGIYAHVVADEN